MKIFNLLNAVGFIFLLGSSVMAAEEAPRVKPPVPPKNTYHRLATQLIDFWCSPLGHEMLNLFKDEHNQDAVINSLGLCESRGWKESMLDPKIMYPARLIQRILIFNGGTKIFGNKKYHELHATDVALKGYLNSEWTHIGFINEILKNKSRQKELRQKTATDLVNEAIDTLQNTPSIEWLKNRDTRRALGKMLRWIFLSSCSKFVIYPLEKSLPEQDVEQIKAEVRAKGGIIY